MAEIKTGWTKPLPTADGDYFSRIDEYDKSPTLIRIENGAVYEMGQGGNLVREYAAEDYEYLGPFTPSDFEQLTRLREALSGLKQRHGCWCELPPNAGSPDHTFECDRAREALAQRRTGEQS